MSDSAASLKSKTAEGAPAVVLPAGPILRAAAGWVLLGAAAALVVVGVAMPDHALRLTGFALSAFIAASSLWALNRGRGRLAAQAMVYGVWFATVTSAALNGGLASPAIAVPPVAVLLAGWLLGARSALLLALASAMVFGAMALGARLGLLLPPAPPPTTWLLLVHTVVLAVATALAVTLSRGFAARLAEARTLSSSLEARLADLASRDRALAEHGQLHDALLNAQSEAGIGLFIVEDQRIGYVNDAACRIYEADAEAIRKKESFLDLVHPDDRARVLRNHLRRLAGEEFANRYDIAVLTAAGARREVEITATRMTREGRPVILVVMVDVSQRKQAEAALKLSEQRFRLMAEQSADWVWSVDLEGRCTYSNVVVESMLGYPPDVFLRELPACYLHPEDTARHRAVFLDAVHSRRGWRNLMLRWRHADGRWRTLESNATGIFDASGKLMGFQGIDRDVTEREEAQRALAESRARFMDLVNSTDGIVWEADAKTFNFSFVSEKAERLLGFPVADWYRPGFWVEHLHPDDREQASTYCAACTKRLESHQFEYRFIARDGKAVWLQDIVTVVAENGVPARLRGLMVDITERRAAEDALRQMNEELESRVAASTAELRATLHELQAFNYSASHDLRAPLRGVEGFSSLLLMDYGDKLDAVGRDYLTRIRRAAQRMAHLLDDMLDLSRLSRRELDMSDTDLSAIAAGVIEELLEREPEPHTEVLIEPGMHAYCDPELTRSVLTNLIGNAWKFSRRQAAPRVEVSSSREAEGTVFHIRDNGVGFHMDHADKLFRAFQRLHGPAEFEGSGIGLASAARIIQRHGGRIWAESAPGAGATFHFTLEAPRRATRAA